MFRKDDAPCAWWTFLALVGAMTCTCGARDEPEQHLEETNAQLLDCVSVNDRPEKILDVPGIGGYRTWLLVTSRCCHFKDVADFTSRFNAANANSGTQWPLVEKLLQSGDLCVSHASGSSGCMDVNSATLLTLNQKLGGADSEVAKIIVTARECPYKSRSELESKIRARGRQWPAIEMLLKEGRLCMKDWEGAEYDLSEACAFKQEQGNSWDEQVAAENRTNVRVGICSQLDASPTGSGQELPAEAPTTTVSIAARSLKEHSQGASTTEQPYKEEPAAQPSITEPATEPPTTEEPMKEKLATEASTTEEPMKEKLAMEASTTEELSTEEANKQPGPLSQEIAKKVLIERFNLRSTKSLYDKKVFVFCRDLNGWRSYKTDGERAKGDMHLEYEPGQFKLIGTDTFWVCYNPERKEKFRVLKADATARNPKKFERTYELPKDADWDRLAESYIKFMRADMYLQRGMVFAIKITKPMIEALTAANKKDWGGLLADGKEAEGLAPSPLKVGDVVRCSFPGCDELRVESPTYFRRNYEPAKTKVIPL